MRVFTISDLHLDYPENTAWVQGLSSVDYKTDALIVSGDISDKMAVIQKGLTYFQHRFMEVVYVPGNHEFWIRDNGFSDSMDKFQVILDVCKKMGVRTSPVLLGKGDNRPVKIVPLFSWYIKPEDGPGGLYVNRPEDPGLRGWSDEVYVKWPNNADFTGPAETFLELNARYVQTNHTHPVITFSHFLPRKEVMFADPGTRIHPANSRFRFNFSRVAGCLALDKQIRTIKPVLHIYGHQHRNRKRQVDGLWYLSHCLGYPRERDSGFIRNVTREPLLVWDTNGIHRYS